jgi:hypothetical protein
MEPPKLNEEATKINREKDIQFVRNTLEYALSQINRNGDVTEDCLKNLEKSVGLLKGKPDFVEPHPAHDA